LKISRDRVAKIANTEIIITAALVTTPAVVLMPCETASNAEIVRQVLKAWNGGDVEAMVGRLTSDFEFVTAGVVPDLRRGISRPSRMAGLLGCVPRYVRVVANRGERLARRR
jgi:hypothetical protein